MANIRHCILSQCEKAVALKNQLRITPQTWEALLLTTQYIEQYTHCSTPCVLSTFAELTGVSHGKVFENELFKLYLKGAKVLHKPVRRVTRCLTFTDLTAFIFSAEVSQDSPQHLAHYLVLLLQFRAILRYGKLVAPREEERTPHLKLNDPDDDRIRMNQLTVDSTPFPLLQPDNQQAVIDKLLSGRMETKIVLFLTQKHPA